jgi:hypothetical protein
VTKGPRRRCQSLRATVRSHRRGLEQRFPLDRERAGPHSVPGTPDDGLGLPGQIGFVKREPVCRHNRSVSDHLVTGSHADEVSHHHLVDRQPAVDPVAHHDRLRSDQRGEPVESSLGADLLQ